MSFDLPGGWSIQRLDEVAEIIGGGTPSTKVESNFGDEFAWITPKDLSDHQGRYVSRGERSLSKRGLDNSSARMLPDGTVLISSRAPIGYVAIARGPVSTNQGFRSLVLRDGHVPEFYYYLISANVDLLKSHASGTTFREISGTSLGAIELPIPPEREQREIATILGAFDNRIEVNLEVCYTLERVFRAMFESWFLRFDPVRARANGDPCPGLTAEVARLFPDSLAETSGGPVPRGWTLRPIGDLVENVKLSVAPEDQPPRTPYVGLEHIPRRSVFLPKWGEAETASSTKRAFERDDILFGRLRAYFHKVVQAPIAGICSTDVLVLRPKDERMRHFCLGHLAADAFVSFAHSGSTGTRMPRAQWDHMRDYAVAVPPDDLLARFADVMRPLLDLGSARLEENGRLLAARNTLLPKMLAGEVVAPTSRGRQGATVG